MIATGLLVLLAHPLLAAEFVPENAAALTVLTNAPVTLEASFAAPRETVGVRLRSRPTPWTTRMPTDLRVYGDGRLLAAATNLPPCFAGESVFLAWPQTTASAYRIEILDGGMAAVLSYGIHAEWLDAATRRCYGRPFDATRGPRLIELDSVSFFDRLPEDFPAKNAPELACPDYRLVKDWLMQDFGVEGAATNRPSDMAAYVAKCRARRTQRLRALRKRCDKIVYVKHFTFQGNTEHSSTAYPSDDFTDARPKHWTNGGELCLLTILPDGTVTNEVLLARPNGCIRDPNLSRDGRTLVFSMKNEWPRNRWAVPFSWAHSFGWFDDVRPGGKRPWAFYENLDGDDFHLYTMDLETRKVKQVTFSDPARCSDIEPCWSESGRIVFESTRCEMVLPCHQTMICNTYSCKPDGSDIRRLTVDTGPTMYPQEFDDGRILYQRYEYNDRNAALNQALFTMQPDGRGQKAIYGNGKSFPTSLHHARPIPGTGKVLAVLAGHHVAQKGKLVKVDPDAGCDGDEGLWFVAGAALDDTPGVVKSHWADADWWNCHKYGRGPIDHAGQVGAQWQYPHPLSEREWLCAFVPEGCLAESYGRNPSFGIYWQNEQGERELLAWDPTIECLQPVAVMKRKRAFRVADGTDAQKSFGTFCIQDVYQGRGMQGVKRGTVKKLRVCAIEGRPMHLYAGGHPFGKVTGWLRDTLGWGGSDRSGESITANGAWDIKHVLGEVDVDAEGRCAFECPVMTPVYFQLIDAEGRSVQTMRSWATLMPGENQSCIGCHERPDETYLSTSAPIRGLAVQRLQPAPGCETHPLVVALYREGALTSVTNYLGVNAPRSADPEAETDGFSYRRRIQPILDRSCVRCHSPEIAEVASGKRPNLTGAWKKDFKRPAARKFSESYAALTGGGVLSEFCNWYHLAGRSEILRPYEVGSGHSKLLDYFTPKHHGVEATDTDRRVVAMWIDLAIPFGGSYAEATIWDAEDRKIYEYHQQKRVDFARREMEGGR